VSAAWPLGTALRHAAKRECLWLKHVGEVRQVMCQEVSPADPYRKSPTNHPSRTTPAPHELQKIIASCPATAKAFCSNLFGANGATTLDSRP